MPQPPLHSNVNLFSDHVGHNALYTIRCNQGYRLKNKDIRSGFIYCDYETQKWKGSYGSWAKDEAHNETAYRLLFAVFVEMGASV